MTELMTLVALVLSVSALRKASRTNKQLTKRLDELEELLRGTRPVAPAAAVVATAPVAAAPMSAAMSSTSSSQEMREDWESALVPATPLKKAPEPAVEDVAPLDFEAMAKRRERERKWNELRDQIKSNWTGVLGALILVVGVAFFGVLASLYIGAVGRFALILGFAAVLVVGSRWIDRYPTWRTFGSWLQAVAGAISLFACLGAGGIDGLKFIDDQVVALFVLLAGIGLNLFFAYTSRVQQVAALHVALSLSALAVSPATPTVLLIGTAVTLAGIGLSYRERWDWNLLVILGAFAVFHVIWFQKVALPITESRVFAIPCALAIGLAAALVHYRKDYKATSFELLPFTVHVLNWTLFGANVLVYSTGSNWSIPALAAGAVLATVLARAARKKGIRWLYLTDTLVGQVLAVFAISSLDKVGVSDLDMALLVFFEIVLFHVVCSFEKETALVRLIYAAEWAALGIIASLGLAEWWDLGKTGTDVGVAWRMLAVAGAVFVQRHVYFVKGLALDMPTFVLTGRAPAAGEKSPLGVASLSLFLVPYLLVRPEPHAAAAMSGLLAAAFFYNRKLKDESVGLGFDVATIVFHLIVWASMMDVKDTSAWDVATFGLPLLVLDALAVARVGYLFVLHVAMLTYALTGPISDFVPGVAYLVYSLIALEISTYLRRRSDKIAKLDEVALHAGYFFLLLFMGRHALVHLQSEASLGFISIRLAIELLATGVFAYWLSYAPTIEKETASAVSRVLSPYLWEAALVFVTASLVVELDSAWHPVAWATMALALYAIQKRRAWPARISYWSWVFLVASAVHLAFVSSTFATPSTSWHARSEFLGPLAVLLQMVYVAVVYRGSGYPDHPRFGALFAKQRNALVFYPVIVALGIFLFWRFEKAVLTLLWVGEVFVVFALGIFVREKHFVRVALAFLAFCLARLIIHDLAQTNLALRAAVFVGVGVLMLGINAIYRKFKDRIS